MCWVANRGTITMSTKILIVDDHDVVRHGLRTFLAVRPDWEICGEARTGQEAIEAVASLKPDLAILDITMPGMSGLEAASRIRALGTPIRILIFTMHESPRIAMDVNEAGAHGFVQKSQASRDLILAVERLLAGDTFFGQGPDATPQEAQSKGTPPKAKAAHKSDISLCGTLCFA
jgi:DNA-binding NarL/FixJ family response regulator